MRKILPTLLIMCIILLIGGCSGGPAEYESDLPSWNDRVFYEIFVRSFYDSDGDGIGDIQGVIEKLDYLNDGDPETDDDLGVTGIWLMPINESPSYHGYDVVDYRSINPEYGTMEDFEQLLAEVHARDMVLIMDLVLNHTSSQHPWFQAALEGDPQYEDWYIFSEEDPGYRGPTNQQVWHPRSGKYFYGVFWSEMPDLNYTNDAVTEHMYDVSQYWLDEIGVDGFRLDAIKHLIENGPIQESTPETLAWFEAYEDFLTTIDEDALTVGEVWSGSDTVADYIPDKVDIAFEFQIAEQILAAANRERATQLIRTLDTVLETYPRAQYAPFLANHDQERVMSALREQPERAKSAASILLTLPGVPFIYYGEEIGMLGEKPDERIRTPMQWNDTDTAGFTTGTPWQPLQENVNAYNLEAQRNDPNSLWTHYDTLIDLRNTHQALRVGFTNIVDTGNDRVYSIIRYTPNEIILVIVNLSDDPMSAYVLNLPEGTLTSSGDIEVLMGPADPTPLELNEAGGFTDYLPYDELPGQSTIILRINGTAELPPTEPIEGDE